jgi:ribosomal protein S6
MKKYEGLFILNTAGREEGIKEAIDRISAEIVAVGGLVETTQKMDKRAFARTPNKKVTAGFYLNVIFSAPPAALAPLRNRFVLSEDVYRVIFTLASAAPPPATAVPTA